MSPAAWREHVERVVREEIEDGLYMHPNLTNEHRDAVAARVADRLSAPVLSAEEEEALRDWRAKNMPWAVPRDEDEHRKNAMCRAVSRLIAGAKPPAVVGEAYIVCSTCRDTHQMALGDGVAMCTRCPTPCQTCRGFGGGAYCKTTPCGCSCHVAGAKP